MNALHSFYRGAGQAAILLLTVAMASAWAAAPTASPAARSELAPAGKLRVGVLITNPAFIAKDGSPAEMRGVAADLGRELAKQVGASFEPVRYQSIAKLVDGAKAGEWDVAFLGFEAERAAWMDYSAPYLEIGNSYLVLAGSSLRTVKDVDGPGIQIGITERSVQERYLTRNLKQAKLVPLASAPREGPALLSSGKIQAIAGNRVSLAETASKVPGARILEGTFDPARHALGVAKGRPAGTAFAKDFIEHAKASGLVQQAIDRAALQGVNVAPRASRK